MTQKISVLINTLNEENNIRECLEMLTWADEIVIVDQCSDDKTVDIAKEYTDKIFLQERKGYASREYGYTKLLYDWILIIDADELVPLELINEFRRIAENDLADVVIIPRKTYGFGKLVDHGRWNCLFDMQIRFGKKEAMILQDIAHLDFAYKTDARILKIMNPDKALLHFAHLDFEQYINKMNLYTTFEANNIFDGRKKKVTLIGSILRGIKGFINGYLVLGGYKDGSRGIAIHLLDFFYITLVYIKYKQINIYKTKDVRQSANQTYKTIKQEVIAAYQGELKNNKSGK